MDTQEIYPVPDNSDDPSCGFEAGPEMPGTEKPTRDGRYLRYFADCDDWAWSWFLDGEWTRNEFFASAGGVIKPATKPGK